MKCQCKNYVLPPIHLFRSKIDFFQLTVLHNNSKSLPLNVSNEEQGESNTLLLSSQNEELP